MKNQAKQLHVVSILGPTGGGKAKIARRAAMELGAVVISCDSMKIYKGMTIGTAKPAGTALEDVEWRGVDLVDPWETFDTSDFANYCHEVFAEAAERGKPVFLSGGTSLYLKALTEGMFRGAGKDPAIRQKWENFADENGLEVLHGELKKVDPTSADKLHPNDRRRVVRALEVFDMTGKPISSLQTQFGGLKPGVTRSVFFVRRSREDMDVRINNRVDRMMSEGWLDECRALVNCGHELSRTAMQAIGYRQLFDFIQGGGDLEQVVTDIKTKTRRFARRQLTWLKHFPDATVVNAEADGTISAADFAAIIDAVRSTA